MSLQLAPRPDLPEVRIGIDLSRMADESIAALAKVDGRTFARGGALVQVVKLDPKPGVAGSGLPAIRPLALITLQERLGQVASFLRFDGTKETWRKVAPPKDVVLAVHSRNEWLGIRPLTGIVTAPTMRPDGTLVQKAGYDRATGLLYLPNAAFPEVPQQPTIDDARAAVAACLEPVVDFPFATDHDRTAWLAGLLTLVARAAIVGPVPLFAVDATTRGTGKSLLVDIISRIVFGDDAPRMSQVDNEDDQRKRITSAIMSGKTMQLIDNVVGPLGGPSLDSVLTCTTWEDRILGATALVSLPHTIVWFTTGNNLALKGDLTRRTLRIRMESTLEAPEERTGFQLPSVLSWASHHRARLVSAALTILRAFVVAGRPKAKAVWGSYDSWTDLVAHALIWLGLPDPLICKATQDLSLDQDRACIARMIQFWPKVDPDNRGIALKSLLQTLYVSRTKDAPPDGLDDLREAIEAMAPVRGGQSPDSTKLGIAMRRLRGRVVEGARIISANDRNGIARWRVERV